MLYALLIFQDEDLIDALSPEERESLLQAHRDLQSDTLEKNTFVNATQLMSGTSATTLKRKAGETIVMDGPYTETKELFVGFYIIECNDLAEAITHANRIPYAGMGSIEIRPVNFISAVEKHSD